jgi:transcription antitermination factor NusG
MSKWLLIHTRPRWEKKVHLSLLEKGIESYCPLNRIHRNWSDRVKLVEEPLFKRLVFLKVNDNDRTVVRMISGVVNFVYRDGKLAFVKDREVETIRQFLATHGTVELIESANGSSIAQLKETNGKTAEKRKAVKLNIDSQSYLIVASQNGNLLIQ